MSLTDRVTPSGVSEAYALSDYKGSYDTGDWRNIRRGAIIVGLALVILAVDLIAVFGLGGQKP